MRKKEGSERGMSPILKKVFPWGRFSPDGIFLDDYRSNSFKLFNQIIPVACLKSASLK